MFRTIFLLAILMTLACGGQDSGSTAGSAAPDGGTTKADTGPGKAKIAAKLAAAEAAKTAEAEARRAAAASVDPEVASCLGLIREANYPEALTVCTEAARIDPDNRDVQAALEIAGASWSMRGGGDLVAARRGLAL